MEHPRRVEGAGRMRGSPVSGPGLRRVAILRVVLTVALVFLAGRLFWIQVELGPGLAAAAHSIHVHRVVLPVRRGDIVGRSGLLLAVPAPADEIYADPLLVQHPGTAAARLAKLLPLPESLIHQRLTAPGQFVWIDRQVTPAAAAAIRALGLPGLYERSIYIRRYPQGMFLGHVLGFVGLNGRGLAGVEYSYNSALAGRNGYEVVGLDALGRVLPQTVERRVPPTPGLTLRLTIDPAIQWRLMRDLGAQAVATGARQAWGLAMDPSTGSILALSAWPTFNPNKYASVPPSRWTDPVVSNTFPPGSIFKPLTASAALDSGVVSPLTPFFDPGNVVVDGVPLHNFQTLGRQTNFTRAFEESADVIFARVGLRMGLSRFYGFLKSFGLLGPTGVDLPGESPAPDIIRPAAHATKLTLAEMSYGESLTVTPLSLMTALNAVANGGLLMWPHVGSALLGAGGRVVRRIAPRVVRRVIPQRIAHEVQSMMEGVVRYGTGERGFIPCFNVAGKTGTSNLYGPQGVVHGHYNASFYTYAPAHHARVAVLVTLVDPRGVMHDGGEVAAPVAQDVLRMALHQFGVPPHCTALNRALPLPGQPGTTRLVLYMTSMPSIDGMTPAAARAALLRHRLYLTVKGHGSRVLRQSPAPGATVQQWTTVDAFTTPVSSPPAAGPPASRVSRPVPHAGPAAAAGGSGGGAGGSGGGAHAHAGT